MDYTNALNIDATLVANEFLDNYMPKANGDYVKVYLFLLKNRVSGIDVGTVAEKLQLTEGDVRRAVKYWESEGILSIGGGSGENSSGADTVKAKPSGETAPAKDGTAADNDRLRSRYRTAASRSILDRLYGDDEFVQLLKIVQKYLSKILNDTEQQVFAYLYDGLKLPVEVIDYLVQYCVENGHSSTRYIEKVGLDWAQKDIRDTETAREYTRRFDENVKNSRRKKTSSRDSLGVSRRTDYDSKLLEEVIQKMM